jgi:surface antigen
LGRLTITCCIDKPEEHAAAVAELRQLAGDRVTSSRSWRAPRSVAAGAMLNQDVYRQVADLDLEAGAHAEQIEYRYRRRPVPGRACADPS